MTEQVKAPSLSPMFLFQAEAKRLTMMIEAPAGVPLSRVMEPDYLCHCAPRLSEGFHIEVLAADNSWYAELMVRKVNLSKHEVHCWLLQHVILEDQVGKTAAPTAEQFKIAFGGAHKWRVIRLSDNEVIHHGEPSESDAKAWLAEYLGKVAA